MARTGVYFSDVKRARDALVAEGRRPSIDAVRAALGNTGSKTTIHRYLREIEAEEGGRKASISDAVLELVTQLADQLQSEAAADVDAVRAQMAEQEAQHAQMRSELEAKLAESKRALDAASQQLVSIQEDIVGLKDQLGSERISKHIAEQRSLDLSERLADAERHQISLEEKHRHARDALEHYRSASKEQREQENRRHEQQVQALQVELRQTQLAAAAKHEELTRLNKEAAALATELGSTKQALYGEREAGRNLARRIEQLQVVEARVAVLEANLAESRARTLEAEQASERSAEFCNELRRQNTMLEAELASVKGALALEERLAKLDKAVFGAKEPGGSPNKAV
jgi:hypothetical protein